MNILVCTSSNSSYNSIRPELEIYISMANAGHNVTIITHKNALYNARLMENSIEVIEKPVIKKLSISSILLIRRVIKKNKIDIVFATNSKSIPNAAFACIGLDVKCVAYRGTVSGLYWHDPGNYLGILNPRIDGVVCVSKYVYNYVASRPLLKNKNVIAIYKGHDLSWYNKKAADLSEFGINKNDFTAICVINSRPHKGLHIILEATKKLSDLENFHLLLVGNGADKEPYKSLLESSPMKQRIHVAGYRDDAPELIAASDTLVQPSISGEGLPRVILESLAYKTPVITSANEGSMEIITDGENGLVVPIKDPDALADSIRKLHNDPELLATLKSNSQNILKNEMSHRVTVENFIKYFESLLKH